MENVDYGNLFIAYRDEGNLTAFEQVMDGFHRPLFNYLFRMLHNREEAEDSLQDVWLKVIKQKASYNHQGQFSSWLYRIARNHCYDIYRKKGRRPMEDTLDSTEMDTDIPLIQRLSSEEHTPYEQAIENEIMSQVDQVVAKLPEAIREVYLLRIVNDLSFKEIAEIQQAPLGTVLSRMHQATRKIEEEFAGSDSEAKAIPDESS